MPAGFDSWTDDIERGDGYAIGGTGARQNIRPRQKWRADLARQARLVAIDLAILLACAGIIDLAVRARSHFLFIVAAIICLAAALWFRHQRLEHERRPR